MQAGKEQLAKMVMGDLFGTSFRVVAGVDGEPWFVAKDVCGILGLENNRRALMVLDEDEKGVTTSNTLGGDQTLNTVSESGLYALILKSRRPEAKAFRRWITREVLPSIRKTGLYCGDAAGLPATRMRVADYMRLRGITGRSCGISCTAGAVCRHSGLEIIRDKFNKGNLIPVAALDKAADGKPALRGPLCQESGFHTYIFTSKAVAS